MKLIGIGVLLASCLALGALGVPAAQAAPSGVSATARATEGEAELSGRVHAMGSPDPVAGAEVRVVGPGLETATDTKGEFSLRVPAGAWTVKISADGFAGLARAVTLTAGAYRRLNIGLNPTEFEAEAVSVKAHRERPQAIQATITQQQMKEIPGTFGDALRAIQVLPGIAAPNDFQGTILIQGGGPGDNQFFIDNLPWPDPEHFGGLASTINPDLLDKVDVYEAGYGARWGGALAGILDAKTVPLPSDRLHIDADASILQASLLLDGPLGLGDATFALSGRRSYFDLVAGIAGITAFPYYWDGQAVLDFSLGKGNKFHALAMGSDDTLAFSRSATDGSNSNGDDFSGSIHYNNDYQTGGMTWTNTAVDHLVSNFTPYVYHTDSTIGVDQFVIDSYKTSYGIKEEATWSPGKWLGVDHEIGAGGDVELSDYTFQGFFPRVTSTAQTSFSSLTNMAATASTVGIQGFSGYVYVQDRIQVSEAWALTLGLHYDTTNLVPEGEVGPRLGLEWKPDPDNKVAAAWGLYDQAPSPLNVNPQFGNPGLQPEEAEHSAISYEHRFNGQLVGLVDAYYKALTEIVVSDPANAALYDNEEIGFAKGADLSLRDDISKQIFGLVSYSYEDSRRLTLPGQPWTLYEYDYPNILNLAGSYSPSPRWSFGGKIRYNSGNLVEPPGSDVYSERLAFYARVDARAERTWLFQTWTLKAYVEILNLLNRKNPALQFVNNTTGAVDTVDDLPRLPNIGLEANY